jgi:hypothetical protein
MSGQLSPHITVAPANARRTADQVPTVTAHPGFAVVRRAAIRLRAAHVTRGMIRELSAVPQIAAPRAPLFVRLDALQDRYAQLDGDPAELVR